MRARAQRGRNQRNVTVTDAVNDQPPAELLRRLRPIPTYRDHPATVPSDISGVAVDGSRRELRILDSTEPVLLLFLSAGCFGCLDLWEGMAELRGELPVGLQVVVITKGPEHEDANAVAVLSAGGMSVVMSSSAYEDYRVAGPPFLVLVTANSVLTEGVAWGIVETARAVRVALGGRGAWRPDSE